MLPAKQSATDNFKEMARDAWDRADNDRGRAKVILIRAILQDQALYERNREVILERFVGYYLDLASTARRQESPVAMNVVAIDGHAFNEAVRANYVRYMSRPVWGGKPVGSCTVEDLRESARKYQDQGVTMLRESRWHTAVAQELEANGGGSETTVHDALTEATLTKLWEETENA